MAFPLLPAPLLAPGTEQRAERGGTLSLSRVLLRHVFVCGWLESLLIIRCYRALAGARCHFDLLHQRREPATSPQPPGQGDRALQGRDCIWAFGCFSLQLPLAALQSLQPGVLVFLRLV